MVALIDIGVFFLDNLDMVPQDVGTPWEVIGGITVAAIPRLLP